MVNLVTFRLPPFPKPRGGLNRAGKMWHSNPEYLSWKKQFSKILFSLVTPGGFQAKKNCIVFVIHIKQKRGGLLDLENCQGAIQDALKTYKFISDDNYRIISNYVMLSREIPPESEETSYFQFAVCKNWAEMLKAAYVIGIQLEKLPQRIDKTKKII